MCLTYTTRILKLFNSKITWLLEEIKWVILMSSGSFKQGKSIDTLTFGITTYKDRFTTFLKPLVKKTSFLFPECKIIVIANGHVNAEKQVNYIRRIKEFCSKYNNVELLCYKDPKGLSYLWNTIIKRSSYGKSILLNDDVSVKVNFRRFLTESGILSCSIATINSSWSHFLINKDIIIDIVGWFDEGLKEIGGEDDDYLARMAMKNIKVVNFNTDTIHGRRKKRACNAKINSYGKNMSKEEGGYSTLNTRYLCEKWDISDVYFDGAVEVSSRKRKFWKLKEEEQGENYLKDA